MHSCTDEYSSDTEIYGLLLMINDAILDKRGLQKGSQLVKPMSLSLLLMPWLHPWNWLYNTTNSKVRGANMGPTWVLSAPDGPHNGPMNIAIRDS